MPEDSRQGQSSLSAVQIKITMIELAAFGMGYTRAILLERLGVHHSTWNRWRRGVQVPTQNRWDEMTDAWCEFLSQRIKQMERDGTYGQGPSHARH